jgi:hypothetical protein
LPLTIHFLLFFFTYLIIVADLRTLNPGITWHLILDLGVHFVSAFVGRGKWQLIPQGGSMPDGDALKNLEDLLNKDEALRATFIKDPVATMHKHGITLSPDHAAKVKSQIADMQLSKLSTLPERPGIVIEIRISIRF